MTRILEVFVSSPGDLADERRVVAKVVGKLASMAHVQQRGYSLRARLYEDVVPPVLADSAQGAVNAFMMDPARSDVLICLLGDRLGSEMRDPRHPERAFLSGTLYEVAAARESRKRPKPEVMIYSRRAPRPGANAATRRQVEEFVAGIVTGQGSRTGMPPAKFDGPDDLEKMLADDLDTTVTRVMGLYNARRLRAGLWAALAVVAILCGGYELWDHSMAGAREEGQAQVQDDLDRANKDLAREPGQRVKFLLDAIVEGPASKVRALDAFGCDAAPPLIQFIGKLQPAGDLANIRPAIEALAKLASGPSGEQCGCPELLSVLATENLPVRYCKSTHLLALQSLRNLSCRRKSEVVGGYLGKIGPDPSFMSVLCKEDGQVVTNELKALALEVSASGSSAAVAPPP